MVPADRLGLLLGALLLLGAWLPRPVQAQEPAELGRQLEAVFADDAYQTELPGKTAAAGEAARREEREARGARRRSPGGGMVDAGVRALFGFLGPLVYWLAWIALVVAGVLVVGFLVREAWRSRGSSSRHEPPPSPSPREPATPAGRAAVSPPSMAEIEALAARGDFGEAVHLLFLLVLERLRRQGRLVLSSAVTGREALGQAHLPEEPRRALADLVSAVERFHFADLELTREDWERSRETHRRLLEAGGDA